MLPELALREVPRLLTLADRNPHSPTYGCFDRNFWRYKIQDSANMRFQEACYTMALLYSKDIPGNRWRGDENVRELSEAAMRFWAGRQNSDGSFDEYLPGEHSHVATAFSAFAVASACRLLGFKDSRVLSSLKRAGEWLAANDDLAVVNHDAGAVAALYSIYEVTGDGRFSSYADEKLDKVLGSQDEEGWFPEYGGADIGYQSFSIYYLASYWSRSRDQKVKGPLERAVDFFSYFVHPDGSAGGHYGSRETAYVMPSGFSMLDYGKAGAVYSAISGAVSSGRLPGPSSLDDRFLADSLYCFMDCSEAAGISDARDFTRHFKNCGLYCMRRGDLYGVFNLRKGGVGLVYSGKERVFVDTGYVSRHSGEVVSTAGPSTYIVSDDGFNISGGFYKAGFIYQSPGKAVAMRVMNKAGLHGRLKSMMRKRMITGSRPVGVVVDREFSFSGDGIRIRDRFSQREALDRILLTDSFSSIYTTSLGLWQDVCGQGERDIRGHGAEIRVGKGVEVSDG